MSYVQRLTVPVTTAADGSATAYSENVSGRISAVRLRETWQWRV